MSKNSTSGDKKRKTDTEFSRQKSSLIEKLESLDEDDVSPTVLVAIEKIIAAKQTPLYVCEYCDNMAFSCDDFKEFRTAEDTTGMVCPNCISVCKGCGHEYCPSMAYRHKDCKVLEEEEEDEEDKEQETNEN